MSSTFTLPIGWGRTKIPRSNTAAQVTAAFQGSFYESLTQYPVWDFTMTVPYLSGRMDDPTSGISQLMGLYFSCNGRAGTFLFNDPFDNTVTAANFGTGDGSSQTFQLVRPMGTGGNDIVQNLNGAPSLYNNGTLLTSGYSIDSKGVVTFDSAPADGHALTWTGSFYFRLRFKEDTLQELKEFFNEAWTAQLDFESVIL
jgi:hypothetical protein